MHRTTSLKQRTQSFYGPAVELSEVSSPLESGRVDHNQAINLDSIDVTAVLNACAEEVRCSRQKCKLLHINASRRICDVSILTSSQISLKIDEIFGATWRCGQFQSEVARGPCNTLQRASRFRWWRIFGWMAAHGQELWSQAETSGLPKLIYQLSNIKLLKRIEFLVILRMNSYKIAKTNVCKKQSLYCVY